MRTNNVNKKMKRITVEIEVPDHFNPDEPHGFRLFPNMELDDVCFAAFKDGIFYTTSKDQYENGGYTKGTQIIKWDVKL